MRRAQADDVHHVAGLDCGARLSFTARFAGRITRVDDHANVWTFKRQPQLHGFGILKTACSNSSHAPDSIQEERVSVRNAVTPRMDTASSVAAPGR